MSSGPIIALELIGEGAINNWRALIGPTDSATARSEAPTSLRARFGAGKRAPVLGGHSCESWLFALVLYGNDRFIASILS